MDLKTLWTDPAVEQYAERLDYLGGFSPDAARRVRRKVDLSLRRVASFPDPGRWVPEFGQGFYREILVKPLRILYKFQGDRIVVTCVHRQEESLGPDSFAWDTSSPTVSHLDLRRYNWHDRLGSASLMTSAKIVPMESRFRFHPYHELQGRPNVIVDGSPTEGTRLCLSHWPRIPTPPGYEADLSAQMAFRYLDHLDLHGDAALVSNNHFDQDGLVSVFALVSPDAARANRDLLTDLAAAGDFGTYRFREAARASMAIAALADPERSPLPAPPADPAAATAALYEALLGRVVELVAHPDRYASLWRDEDACLTESERCMGTLAVIEECPEVDLALVTLPEYAQGLPTAGGHRFASSRTAGLHPMAVHNATPRFVIAMLQGRRYSVTCRYETWVQFRSRPMRPRVDLAPLARELDGLEGAAAWEADPPGKLVAGLRLKGDAESSIPPDRFRALLLAHLHAAAPAWDPYAAGG